MKCYYVVTILAILLSVGIETSAQQGKLPPFRMMQVNGNVFKAEQLPPGKPIVIVYFSPDCDHCEALMKSLFKKMPDFKNASIAMITFLPLNKVNKFVTDYHTDRYANIFVGTEGSSYFLRNYYGVRELPFLALYSKNGDFITSFSREIPLQQIADRLLQLK